jgi:macrolide transport system ATP-binding/permease protein
MKFLRRLRFLFSKHKLDAEMTQEMQAHVDLQTERNVQAGMNATEARYAALRQFGNVAVLQEEARAARGWVWLEQCGQDLRFAVRMLWKSPGITATAVLTLGLGIGVNAALFAVYDILALRPLPSRAPEELVDIRGRNDKRGEGTDGRFSYPDYLDYCAGTEAFSDLVAVADLPVRLPDELPPETDSPGDSTQDIVSFQVVSGNYFAVLGMEPALGRNFLPDEAGLRTGKPVVIVSHYFWQTALRGDPHVLGRILMTEDLRGRSRTAYTIVGVAAPDFTGQSPIPPAAWAPLTGTGHPVGDRSKHIVSLTGRMRAGVSPAQAKADLDLIAQRLAQAYPEPRRAETVHLLPAMRILNVGLDPAFAMAMSPVLLGFVLVLVVACLNVANLLLARGVTRQHEIGVRLVLGAGRGRLVRQLFAENCLLCLLGAGLALLLAMWSLEILKPALVSMLASEPKAQHFVSAIELGLDRRIVGFGVLLAAVAGLTAGLAPALHSVRRDGVFALKGEGSAFGRKLTPARLRGLLLVGQVAICLALLAVSGLMTGKLLRIRAAGTGFATDGVYYVSPSTTTGAASALSSDPLGAIETLRTLPGVASACMVSEIPLRKPGGNLSSVFTKVGRGEPERIPYDRVSPGFFEAFGVPVLRGRAFTLRELLSGAPVVVVSEAAAQKLWPGQEPLGKILPVDETLFDSAVPIPGQRFRDCQVIGVSRDFRSNWGGSAANQFQLLLFPLPAKIPAANILVRLQTDSLAVVRGVEETAAAAGLPVKFQKKLAEIVDQGLWPYRAFAAISGTLTALALVLATVGLYGVVSFGVNQRVREIGVRMALGATAERVTGLFVRQGMRLVAWGVGFGLAGGVGFAVLLGKVMEGADFHGTPAFRCTVFAVVTGLLVLVALIACWLPARRAARVDPMIALRAE